MCLKSNISNTKDNCPSHNIKINTCELYMNNLDIFVYIFFGSFECLSSMANASSFCSHFQQKIKSAVIHSVALSWIHRRKTEDEKSEKHPDIWNGDKEEN